MDFLESCGYPPTRERFYFGDFGCRGKKFLIFFVELLVWASRACELIVRKAAGQRCNTQRANGNGSLLLSRSLLVDVLQRRSGFMLRASFH